MPPLMKTHSIDLKGSSAVAALLAIGMGAFSPVTTGHAANATATLSPPEAELSGVVVTHAATLNDLLRRLPVLSRAQQEDLAGLSAIQEVMLVHERRMRGEGLDGEFPARFADLYAAIVSALVEDRITMNYGRELLHVHRQLLDRAHAWQAGRSRDSRYRDLILAGLAEVSTELATHAEPLEVVPLCVRTPMVKGHLLWIEELIRADCQCRVLSRGELGSLRMAALRLERFEGYYKRDLHLSRIERENLHERLIALNQDLIDAVRR